ncbi:MAG TPA: PQQ-binding-like beta-propeller repeat protein [Streptosporangiaceae bacterium]
MKATIAGLVLGLAAVAGAVPAAGAAAVVSSGPGAQLWVSRYNGLANGGDGAHSVAVSPDGNTVYVTGYTAMSSSTYDYGTVAYDTATGAQLWASQYGPANGSAEQVAVSPDGKEVFVTGRSTGQGSNYDYATVAYNAASGAQLWASRYNGPASNYDAAAALAVSPDGTTVLVTGTSWSATSGEDYVTIAYDAATGAQLWSERYNGPGNRNDVADSVAVAPGGDAVYVTGTSQDTSSGYDYATVAYSTTTGAQLWLSRFSGPLGLDFAAALTVSPTTGAVFVTGYSKASTSFADYATISYNGATGAQLWAKRYNDPNNGNDQAAALAVSPDGNSVFVTGESSGSHGLDYVTVAYNAASGIRQWASRYNGQANGYDTPFAVAVSPDSSTVYVTGSSQGAASGYDYATVAYGAATGARSWARRYNGPGNGNDTAHSMAVSPTTGTVFVTGLSQGSGSSADYATIAYNG